MDIISSFTYQLHKQGNDESNTNYQHNHSYLLRTFHLETALFHLMGLLMEMTCASTGMALGKFETAPQKEQVVHIQAKLHCDVFR
jgi:hypothetical protein